MISNSELEEIRYICNERKIMPEDLLEERIAPLQENISKSNGELICALMRNYESSSCSPDRYSLRETLYAGIITKKTRLTLKWDLKNKGAFVLGVDKPYSLERYSPWERDFTEQNDGSFKNWLTDHLFMLYFMEKPPVAPEERISGGCFGGYSGRTKTKKQRLELYIGNQQSVPFLQNMLEGWRYMKLSNLLGYELPISEEVRKNIENEQMDIFDRVRNGEARIEAISEEKEKRIKMAKEGDGAINFGTHVELTDEFVEKMRYNPQIRESAERIKSLLETAVKRNYHEMGMQVERKLDAGVLISINLRDFFADRKIKYKI